jgi:hypothetical protein
LEDVDTGEKFWLRCRRCGGPAEVRRQLLFDCGVRYCACEKLSGR